MVKFDVGKYPDQIPFMLKRFFTLAQGCQAKLEGMAHVEGMVHEGSDVDGVIYSSTWAVEILFRNQEGHEILSLLKENNAGHLMAINQLLKAYTILDDENSNIASVSINVSLADIMQTTFMNALERSFRGRPMNSRGKPQIYLEIDEKSQLPQNPDDLECLRKNIFQLSAYGYGRV